ncbi:RidA family protein [Ancylobacter sp. VNQ12]|uniref:RidA family protein n=1 Tax=Ancylobacter sp. VNQ12 TaxID=3400920 RepID=UPI003C118F33
MKLLNSLPEIDVASATLAIRNGISIETDALVTLSGFAGIDFKTHAISDGPFGRHAHGSNATFEYILGSMGLSLDHFVKVRCFLQDSVRDFPEWNAIFKERFAAPYLCRTTVGAPLVVGLIEVE